MHPYITGGDAAVTLIRGGLCYVGKPFKVFTSCHLTSLTTGHGYRWPLLPIISPAFRCRSGLARINPRHRPSA
jgi:hypothetical protein